MVPLGNRSFKNIFFKYLHKGIIYGPVNLGGKRAQKASRGSKRVYMSNPVIPCPSSSKLFVLVKKSLHSTL